MVLRLGILTLIPGIGLIYELDERDEGVCGAGGRFWKKEAFFSEIDGSGADLMFIFLHHVHKFSYTKLIGGFLAVCVPIL